jgi:IS30 family transposase
MITGDNSKEFPYHEQMSERLKCDVYFADPIAHGNEG